jgi:hypothetical protein
MKQTVSFCQFCDAFDSHERNDSFTYDGKKALFEFIEDLDEQCGMETELDIIALCCEFSEYDNAIDCISTCGYGFTSDLEYEEEEEEEEEERESLEWLSEHTMVIQFNGGIIIQDF